jgi:hypothetical protein
MQRSKTNTKNTVGGSGSRRRDIGRLCVSYNPVDKPLRIVALAFGFDSHERLEGRVNKSDNARQRTDAHGENDDQSK